jgi:DNA-binding NtrC family response regulator
MQLQVLEGERVLLAHLLKTDRVVVGRSDSADVALPSETVSRVHAVLERRGGAWHVVDRSRHGLRLDGEVVRAARVPAGSLLEIGPYRIRLLEVDPDAGDDTATRLVRPADHEDLVDLDSGGVVRRAELRIVEGPCRGERHELARSRVRLGGPGAHVVLDGHLPPDAMVLRVARGRVVAEPGSRPGFLEGQRLREPTPALDGELLRVGEHVVEVRSRVVSDGLNASVSFGDLVGSGEAMRRLFATLERVARHDATVLLLGETGTGKELAARAVHEAGPRRDRSFVAVNCAAIPETLVESELFGHEAGAFTGAAKRQDGAFHRAHGGTLFLDELGEMTPEVQAKLLRALESGEVRRVGGREPEFPDVRVVAATHRHLAKLVDEGRFRRDLFYRLCVLTVPLPPLREHVEDIPDIARMLLARQHPGARLDASAIPVLQAYPWPGNVRELRNVLTRAVVLHGPSVEAGSLTFDPFAFAAAEVPAAWTNDDVERSRIESALARARGNRAEAARDLGLARTSLLYRMRRLGLV